MARPLNRSCTRRCTRYSKVPAREKSGRSKKFNVHTTQSSGNIRREARSQSTLTVVTTRLVELRQLWSKYSTSIPTTKFKQREETMADVPAKGACKIGEYTSAFLLSVGGTSRPAVVCPSTRVSSAPIHVLFYSSSPLSSSLSLSPPPTAGCKCGAACKCGESCKGDCCCACSCKGCDGSPCSCGDSCKCPPSAGCCPAKKCTTCSESCCAMFCQSVFDGIY